jgi:hypothetical protein
MNRVQELLPQDARLMRARETFIFLLCALLDRQIPAAVGAMVQGYLERILGSAHQFTHRPFRDEWTVGFLPAVSQFVKRQRSWEYGQPWAVLASPLEHLSNLYDYSIVLAQVRARIWLVITRLISRYESILWAAIL